MSISGTKPQPAAHREPATEHITEHIYISMYIYIYIFFNKQILGEVPPMCISGRKTTCSSVCFPTVRNPPVQAMWRVGFPLHKPYILCKRLIQLNLVGGLNPVEKYARQIGSSPQVGMKIKKCLSCHHLVTSFPENYNSLKLTFNRPISNRPAFWAPKRKEKIVFQETNFVVLSFVSFRKSSQK